MNTQMPQCIPATLHCTPIEPCPTFQPCTHMACAQPQANAMYPTPTPATHCFICPTIPDAAMMAPPTPTCPAGAAVPSGAATICPTVWPPCHTHVMQTSCPPATVCPQPTTLCPAPEQAAAANSVHICATTWTQPITMCPPAAQPMAMAAPAQGNVGPVNVNSAHICATTWTQPFTVCPPCPAPSGAATVCTQLIGCHTPGPNCPIRTPGCTQICPAPSGAATVCTQLIGCHTPGPNCVLQTPGCTHICPGTAATVCTQLFGCHTSNLDCVHINTRICPGPGTMATVCTQPISVCGPCVTAQHDICTIATHQVHCRQTLAGCPTVAGCPIEQPHAMAAMAAPPQAAPAPATAATVCTQLIGCHTPGPNCPIQTPGCTHICGTAATLCTQPISVCGPCITKVTVCGPISVCGPCVTRPQTLCGPISVCGPCVTRPVTVCGPCTIVVTRQPNCRETSFVCQFEQPEGGMPQPHAMAAMAAPPQAAAAPSGAATVCTQLIGCHTPGPNCPIRTPGCTHICGTAATLCTQPISVCGPCVSHPATLCCPRGDVQPVTTEPHCLIGPTGVQHCTAAPQYCGNTAWHGCVIGPTGWHGCGGNDAAAAGQGPIGPTGVQYCTAAPQYCGNTAWHGCVIGPTGWHGCGGNEAAVAGQGPIGPTGVQHCTAAPQYCGNTAWPGCVIGPTGWHGCGTGDTCLPLTVGPVMTPVCAPQG